ncbi:HAMP domain-containing methyl-accepting chemotaxis protein [Fodinicurvata sp. EGI_FJ10296]|uniref:methyl-accepting chemotaxis protein n=1 Tax=Fodinicurvata sp. EGI_FJ10296 TaxID=3231908 RepID=UPI00345283CD
MREWLGRFTVSTKSMAVVIVLALVAIVIAGVGVQSLDRMTRAADAIDRAGTEARLGAQLSADVLALNRAEYATAADPGMVEEMRTEIMTRHQVFTERLDRLRARATPAQMAYLEQIGREYDAYFAELLRTLETAEDVDVTISADQEMVLSSVEASRDEAVELRNTVDAFVAESEDIAAERAALTEQQASTAMTIMVLIAVAGIGAGITAGLVIARTGIVAPLNQMIVAMKGLAAGNLETTVRGETRRDEIGDIARALAVFKRGAQDQQTMVEAQHAEAQRKEERAAEVKVLTQTFETEVEEAMQTLASAAEELETTARSMANTADTTSSQAETVAAASTQATANVQTVASATEELTASIEEIGQQVAKTSSIAERADDQADTASTRVTDLRTSAEKIGEIVTLISDIAEQINLLALNATIEAARAGEAGKGFAIVAQEVKQLARQTAQATDDIRARVGDMQNGVEDTGPAIRAITETIRELNEISTAVAASGEQQSAATQEISRNIQEAAHGTQQVADNVDGLKCVSQDTASAAEQVASTANGVATRSEALKRQITAYIKEMQAA